MKEEEKIRHREKGLTFFEILVVVTIIGLMAALVGPRTLKKDQRWETGRCKGAN